MVTPAIGWPFDSCTFKLTALSCADNNNGKNSTHNITLIDSLFFIRLFF